MYSRNYARLLCFALTLACLAGLLAACGTSPFESPLVPTATVAPLTLEQGMGGVRGQIVASPADWAGQEITVYLAAYYAGAEGQGGFFALEPSQAPRVPAGADGAFQMGNIPPGEYVVVIGPGPEAALAIQENSAPKIFEIVAGEILDLGEVSLP